MKRRRARVRIRRILVALLVLTCVACAGICGYMILWNLFHGFQKIPQLVEALAATVAAKKLAEWLWKAA